MGCTIDEIDESHSEWPRLKQFIETHGLSRNGVFAEGADKLDRCLIAATVDGKFIGLLMFLVQPIGPEAGCPTLTGHEGTVLKEAKIRSFFVLDDFRGQGIGTALQREALRRAARRGVYQVRSRSNVSRKANYAIKLKLGYAASPEIIEARDDSQPEGVRKTQSFCFTKRVNGMAGVWGLRPMCLGISIAHIEHN